MDKKINYKLLAIPILVFMSLFYTNYIFNNQIDNLKTKVDSIYFGNFISTNRLHKINSSYQDILIHPINYNKNKDIIISNWKKYSSQFKTEKERKIIDIIDKKIQKSFSIKSVQFYQYLISQIDLLIEHEVYSASLNRKIFLNDYENVSNNLFYIQIFIFIFLLSSLLAIILYVIKANTKLENLKEQYMIDSITDGLTSLYNRKHFDTVFDGILDVTIQNSWTSSFVIIDIDFFKQYNDNYGHDAGDTALKNVSEVLLNIFNGNYEYVFRIGGEEFAILVYNTSIVKMKSKLKSLQTSIQHLQITHNVSDTGILTVSMGVIMIDEQSRNYNTNDLYKLADAKLYSSKENGRDKFTI